ncbi:MAG: hypothetical protein PHS04_11180 [Tissierellia bacterium]|nr:hypothetical protein [Tissierellia bacterium]
MKKHTCLFSFDELKEELSEAGIQIIDYDEYFELRGQYGLINVWKDNPAICWIFWAFLSGYRSR